jgi:hypothetical protein
LDSFTVSVDDVVMNEGAVAARVAR